MGNYKCYCIKIYLERHILVFQNRRFVENKVLLTEECCDDFELCSDQLQAREHLFVHAAVLRAAREEILQTIHIMACLQLVQLNQVAQRLDGFLSSTCAKRQ